MIKKVLVPVGGMSERSPALDAALDLAARFGAHVECLHVTLDPRDSVAYLGDGMTGTMIARVMAAAEKEANERTDRARQVFGRGCGEMNIEIVEAGKESAAGAASFVNITGHPDEIMARRGRLADLIVTRRMSGSTDQITPVALEAAIMETGRPVMAVPPGGAARGSLGSSVAIAWYPSPEASRAVAFAMPFLEQAERVAVIYHGSQKGTAESAQDLVGYLKCHGVEADVRGGAGGGGRQGTGEHLLAMALEADANLLVMGAYTHNRLRQIMFGGTTRHVMENAELPVLLAH